MTEQEKKIIELYRSGLSAKEVGLQIGKSKGGVMYTLHKYDINTNRSVADYDLRTYTVNDNYFADIDCQEKAYILGFIMADGCVLEDRNTLEITIHKKDMEILKMFQELLSSNAPIRTHQNNYVKLSISSKKIVQDLVSLGIVGNKTKVLKMPTISQTLYPHLVRGYFDGDGSIWYDKTSNSYRMQILGTEDVLNGIKHLLSLPDVKLRPTSKENIIYRLGYSGNIRVDDILTILYADSLIHLERKYELYLKCRELREYNSIHKKQTWTNNLGSYACKSI